jgi:phenylalanyl-tRNA synthetase alpha chain
MMDHKEGNVADIVDSLSPMERKLIPYLAEDFTTLKEKSELDTTSTLRALRFLESKGILKLSINEQESIDLGTNGIYYKKSHLPERRLLMALEEQSPLSLEEAQKKAKLSDNEIKVSIGVLKQKALINLANGKLSLQAKKEELMKKTLEEQFLEALPLKSDSLSPEQRYAFEQLKKRKDIIELKKDQQISFSLTEIGKKLSGKEIKSDLVEEVTTDVIKNWNKQKKFRKYNVESQVPRITGGKKHFVSQGIEYAKRIWIELGFQEMEGTLTQSSFWNFDALFTAQDHPVREMQDTFYIKDVQAQLPDKKLVAAVKDAHEHGVAGSKGWKSNWQEKDAQRMVLRTHTTALSANTLAKLSTLKDKKGKFFAVGKCFRNETVDWSHGFEFNQTEGIVIDKDANFSHLLGYLRIFYQKMGFDKIKFVPAYFPYTEPSLEIYAFHPERKIWIELGGAGIMRPEVVIPLLGEYVPVLAWGPGFDRMLMDYYQIKDLREMYQNDLKRIRNMKQWVK